MKASLTPQQANLLGLIAALTVGDVPPTYEALAEAMSTSKGNIHRLLSCLFERGHVTWEYGKSHSLRLTDPLAAKSSAELIAMRDKIDAALVERMA
ncbi:MAG: hypothetical protein V4820_11790 [Pseudomonadota bacterium]